MPLIGDHAPEFHAMTTQGKIDFPADYKGSWVVLFSHPADFTPVCTTEFIALSRMNETFESLNTKLIGLSIDSLHSHLGWIKSIEALNFNNEGKVKIPFPIIADISMNVARKYGMLQTVNGAPMTTASPGCQFAGRNIPEIIRILQSLQLNDKTHYSTPANWQPGDAVVMGAPLTIEEAQERLESSDNTIEHLDWYLTMKKMK